MFSLEELAAAYEEDRAAKVASGDKAREQLSAIDSPQNKLIAIMRENLGIKADKPNEAVVWLPERGGKRESVNVKFGPGSIVLTSSEYSDLPITIGIRENKGGLAFNPSMTGIKWGREYEEFSDKEKREAMGQLNTALNKVLLGGGVDWYDAKENGGMTTAKIDRMLNAKDVSTLSSSVTSQGLETQLRHQFFADVEARLTLERSSVAGLIKAGREVDAEGNITAASIVEGVRQRDAHTGRDLFEDAVRIEDLPLLERLAVQADVGISARYGENGRGEPLDASAPRKGIPVEAVSGEELLDLLPGLRESMQKMGVTGGDAAKDHRTADDIRTRTIETGGLSVKPVTSVNTSDAKPGAKPPTERGGPGS